MRARLAHSVNADAPRRERTVQDLAIGRLHGEDPFRGGRMGIVVDLFRRGELTTDPLELPGKMRLPDAGGECPRVAEQQSLVLVQLKVRQESAVRPRMRHLRNDAGLHGLLNS